MKQALNFGRIDFDNNEVFPLSLGYIAKLKLRDGEVLEVKRVFHIVNTNTSIMDFMKDLRNDAIKSIETVRGILPPSLKEKVKIEVLGTVMSI